MFSNIKASWNLINFSIAISKVDDVVIILEIVIIHWLPRVIKEVWEALEEIWLIRDYVEK